MTGAVNNRRTNNMRTIRRKVYKFSELSEQAKEKAVNNFRKNGIDTDYIYDEAYQTVKEFHKLFGTSEGRSTWLECNTDSIDDNILQLKGVRLRTYLLNNFGDSLYSGKYYNSWSSDKKLFHKKVTSRFTELRGRGEDSTYYWNVYYGLPLVPYNHSCELTGVCYDEDLLQPIYDFIEKGHNTDSFKYVTLQMLLDDCFESLERSLEDEVESRNSDEAIIEEIEANEYEFLQDGSRFV